MTVAADVIDATKNDPRFMRGMALLKEKRLEEAVAIFEDMLRTMIEVEHQSEEALSVAPVYYEYGHALLSVAEATASVFGSGMTQAGSGGDGDVEQEAKETADDLQVAWEMLEIARVIYSRHPDELAIEKELARVYMRLGDLGMESEVFDQASHDYETSLMLRKKILSATEDPDTTLLADLYCCLAIACIYTDASPANEASTTTTTSTTTTSDMETLSREEKGIKYYVLAGRVMSDNIYRVARQCAPQLLAFVQERIPEYAAEAMASTSKGKGKQKAAKESLALGYKAENVATLSEDFTACVQVAASLRAAQEAAESEKEQAGKKEQDDDKSEDKNAMSKQEAELLEYLEIYAELKEKVDAMKESAAATSTSEDAAGGAVTTIGFGSSTASTASEEVSNALAATAATSATTVNMIPVVKKRKITPQTAQPEASKE